MNPSSSHDDGNGTDKDFPTFWNAYPQKVGKRAAESKWKQLKPDLATCLQAIENQRRGEPWQKENGKFIPYPATWLHQGRWEDEPAVNGSTAIIRRRSC